MSGRKHGSISYEHFEFIDSPERRHRFGSYYRFGSYEHFEFIDSPERRHRFGSYYRRLVRPFRIYRLASAEAPLRLVLPLVLPLPLGAVGDLDGLLLGVEAQGLLRLDVSAGDADEEGVVTVLDRVNVAHREHRRLAGLVHEIALKLELGVPGLAAVVETAPPAHARRVLVVAVDHPARTVVVGHGLAALLPSVHEHMHVGLGIVADRRALTVGHRITQVLLQELGVSEELLDVIADLGEPRRDALRLDRGSSVGEELIEGVAGVRGHGDLLLNSPE